MTQKPVIAIDGPAASGKGTLARKAADALGFAHLDTGLLYRAVAFLVLEKGGDAANADHAEKAAQEMIQSFDFKSKNSDLKRENVTAAASLVAAMPGVRNILLDYQRDFAARPPAGAKGAVLDGRDIGTVICPHADVKLYITADLETRAARRLKELQSNGFDATYDTVFRDMRARDQRDAARLSAPMRAAVDAAILDTSHLDQYQALDMALAIIREKLAAR